MAREDTAQSVSGLCSSSIDPSYLPSSDFSFFFFAALGFPNRATPRSRLPSSLPPPSSPSPFLQ